MADSTLYAASGRLIPFNSNSPTGSTFTMSSNRNQYTQIDKDFTQFAVCKKKSRGVNERRTGGENDRLVLVRD